MSPRQLHRGFLEGVGLAPKRFAGLARFQRALQLLGRGRGLTDTALQCGYFDLPHFSREFRQFAGLAPSAFARHQDPLSGAFIRDSSDLYKPTTGLAS
jgi:AraC-like DNA-binding protein